MGVNRVFIRCYINACVPAFKANETQRISTPAGKDEYIANEIDTHLFAAISSDQYRVLYPMFHLIHLIIHFAHGPPHGFFLPNKDDCNFISKIPYKVGYKDIVILNPFLNYNHNWIIFYTTCL